MNLLPGNEFASYALFQVNMQVQSMSYETLKELLNRRPFEPFEIRMSNGEKYEVRHPELALLLKSRIIIGDVENDRTTICGLIHINRIETPQSVQSGQPLHHLSLSSCE